MAPCLPAPLSNVNNTTATLVKQQLQSQPKASINASVHHHPSQPLPHGHSQQHRLPQVAQPTGRTPHPQSRQGPSPLQRQPSLPQAQARQQSPSPINSAPASLTFQQQQKLLLQQQQHFQQAQSRQRQQQQQQQQQHRPAFVPPQAVVPSSQQQQLQGYSQAPTSLQAPQLQQQYSQSQHPQQQQQPPQLQLPQQQQQWQVAQANAAQGQVRQQAEVAQQTSRPNSASPPQGVPRIPQAQQQLLNLQQQLRLQQQMPQQLPQQQPQQLPQSQQQARGPGGVSPHAGRVKSGQAHTLQQIQAMQTQLKVQVQGHSQGQVATALPQHSFSQDQAQGHLSNGIPQVNFNPGQVGQGQPSAALPQARSGQLPSFSPPRAEVSNGPRALPVPVMRSPTASSSGSVAASPVKSGDQPPDFSENKPCQAAH